MSDRKSFIFRKEWRDALKDLSAKERLSIYEAIIDYGITGIANDLSPVGEVAFSIIRGTIDGDIKHQQEIARKRSECGKKGGAPKSNSNARKGEDEPQQPKPVKTKPVEIVTTGDNRRFEEWIESHCPRIYKSIPMMKDAEFMKLKENYGSKAIMEVCLDLENRKDLVKRYSSLYRTLLNWLKNYVKTKHNETSISNPQSRAAQAAELVNRLLEEDDAE